jgi:hypothetical protein
MRSYGNFDVIFMRESSHRSSLRERTRQRDKERRGESLATYCWLSFSSFFRILWYLMKYLLCWRMRLWMKENQIQSFPLTISKICWLFHGELRVWIIVFWIPNHDILLGFSLWVTSPILLLLTFGRWQSSLRVKGLEDFKKFLCDEFSGKYV